jgi:hypothetical protein
MAETGRREKKLSNYCMTLRKREDTRNGEKTSCIERSVELALEEAIDIEGQAS